MDSLSVRKMQIICKCLYDAFVQKSEQITEVYRKQFKKDDFYKKSWSCIYGTTKDKSTRIEYAVYKDGLTTFDLDGKNGLIIRQDGEYAILYQNKYYTSKKGATDIKKIKAVLRLISKLEKLFNSLVIK